VPARRRRVGEGQSSGSTRGGSLTDVVLAARNWSRGESRSWNVTRSWSTTSSRAQGTNWSDATSLQRVYEYTVEPRTLQDLPDYAMLLVESSAGGPVLRARTDRRRSPSSRGTWKTKVAGRNKRPARWRNCWPRAPGS